MNTEIEKDLLKSRDESGYSEKQTDLQMNQKQTLGLKIKQTPKQSKKQKKKIEGEIILQSNTSKVVFESDQ